MIGDAVAGIMARAAAIPEEGDYIVDGLIWCGKCNTPRQLKQEFLGREVVVGCMCSCRSEEYDRQREAEKAEQERMRIKSMRANCIADDALREVRLEDAADGDAIRHARKYVENWEEMKAGNIGLLMWGPTGTGKSHAAACIANALIDQGVAAMTTSFPKLLNAPFQDRAEIIHGLTRYPLLIIDDLGVERTSEFSVETVYLVIDERYKSGKPIMERMEIKLPPAIAAKLRASNGTSSPSGSTDDPLAYERRKCELANQVPGDLKGLDCPICLNRGYMHDIDEKGYKVCRPCSCMKKRNSMRRLARSGLDTIIEDYTFDRFETPHPWQAAAKSACEAYAANPSGWLLLTGQSGAGKSHLCTAVCGALMDAGKEVRYMMWRDDSPKLKAAVNDYEEYSRLIDPLKKVDVLYIDDLFKLGKNQTPTTADVSLAFELLNHRYVSKKPTIISTERTIEELLDMDEAVGSRIYERSKEHYLDFTGRDNGRLR